MASTHRVAWGSKLVFWKGDHFLSEKNERSLSWSTCRKDKVFSGAHHVAVKRLTVHVRRGCMARITGTPGYSVTI